MHNVQINPNGSLQGKMAIKRGKPEGITQETRKFAWKPSVSAGVGCIVQSFEHLLDAMLFYKSIHLIPGQLPRKSFGGNRHL
jgi:hypothetical protein